MRIRTTFLSLSLMVGLAGGAAAATVTSFVGDSAFNTICSLGTANNQACEKAIAEFRGGGPTTYEQSLNTPTEFGAVQAQFDWVKGTTYDFTLSHDAAGTLTFSLGSGPQIITMPNPTGTYTGLGTANTLFIRTRNESATDTMKLSNLLLNGTAIGGLAFGQVLDDGNSVGAGSAGAGYLRISGVPFSDPWTLKGKVTLDWAGTAVPAQSRLNANIKLTEIPVAPIPLPASALLLVAGLGGLAALKRRRSA
jgi:hypothetical protein